MLRKSIFAATLLATGLTASGMAQAADPVGGAILGAGAGALLGHVLGGRDGALIGGALGAVAGATAASAQRASHRAYGYGDPGYGYPPGVAQTLPSVVVSPGVAAYPGPVYPAPVYSAPAYPVPAYPPPVGYGQPVPGYRGVAPAPGVYHPGSGIARAEWERARFEEQQRARWHWERAQRERQHWEREQWARQPREYPQYGREPNRQWQ